MERLFNIIFNNILIYPRFVKEIFDSIKDIFNLIKDIFKYLNV